MLCSRCNNDRDSKDFYQYKGRTKATTVCRHCLYSKTVETRERYRLDWIEYLTLQYGADPKCQICDKPLAYLSGHVDTSVCFDHRHGNETLSVGPSMWIAIRPCNDKNKRIFDQGRFGILCRSCNGLLPKIEHRERWLEQVSVYLKGS